MSIIVNHVDYIYNEKTVYEKKALDDICLNIEDGEYIGIVGHTGCGKSTLMQHLNGLIAPTNGAIYVDGEDISEKSYSKNKLREKVGLVFQYPEHQLFEEDVFTDVCFGPKNLGLDEKEIQLRAYDALKQVGLKDESFYVSPFNLSGGEKRRVAIAGILAMKPKVLILDEPTAGLDPKGRDDILELIDRIHEELKITIIIVSHSMDDLAEHVDRVIVMHSGKIVMDDTTRGVFRRRDDLEIAGLDVPSVTKILSDLNRKGYPVRDDIITEDEAIEEILRVFGQRGTYN